MSHHRLRDSDTRVASVDGRYRYDSLSILIDTVGQNVQRLAQTVLPATLRLRNPKAQQ